MKLIETMIWITMIISLVFLLVLLVKPLNFQDVKSDFKSITGNFILSDKERIIPSEVLNDGYDYESCVGVETMGEVMGISNPKQKACRKACGELDMYYHSNDCEKDLFVCYCEE